MATRSQRRRARIALRKAKKERQKARASRNLYTAKSERRYSQAADYRDSTVSTPRSGGSGGRGLGLSRTKKGTTVRGLGRQDIMDLMREPVGAPPKSKLTPSNLMAPREARATRSRAGRPRRGVSSPIRGLLGHTPTDLMDPRSAQRIRGHGRMGGPRTRPGGGELMNPVEAAAIRSRAAGTKPKGLGRLGPMLKKAGPLKLGMGALNVGMAGLMLGSSLHTRSKYKEQEEAYKDIPKRTPRHYLKKWGDQRRAAEAEAMRLESFPGLAQQQALAVKQAQLASRDPEAYGMLTNLLGTGKAPTRLAAGEFSVGGPAPRRVDDMEIQEVLGLLLSGE